MQLVIKISSGKTFNHIKSALQSIRMTKHEEQKIPPARSPLAELWETTFHLPTEILNVSLTRAEIKELGLSGDHKNIQTLVSILAHQTNENNRETSLRALGMLGSEEAVTALELTWHYPDDRRWVAKKAAANALREMGLWGNHYPLLNPAKLGDVLLRLETQRSKIDSSQEAPDGSLRQRRSDDRVISVSDLSAAKRIQAWTPHEAGKISIETTDKFNIESALPRAERQGLYTHRKAENQIVVVGNTWPGYRSPGPHLALEITTGKTCTIETDSVSENFECRNWHSCLRLLVRTSRWLGRAEE